MKLSASELDLKIREIFAEIYAVQNNGREPSDLTSDTVLLNTGMDSLGFAILVTRLEEELGFDPFTLSGEAYYPTTYGDFLAFYSDNQPK